MYRSIGFLVSKYGLDWGRFLGRFGDILEEIREGRVEVFFRSLFSFLLVCVLGVALSVWGVFLFFSLCLVFWLMFCYFFSEEK